MFCNITHHFSLQDIFHIVDLISNSSLNVPTQKFAGIRSDNFHWMFWENREESRKSKTWVLSRTDQINFVMNHFPNSVHIKRNITFSEDVFLRFVVVAIFQIISVVIPNSTCSYWMLMEKYFKYDLVDQFVVNNPIL